MCSRFIRQLSGLLAASLVLLVAPLGAQPKPGVSPVVTGHESTVDIATRELVVHGDAKAVYGDIVLTADEIRYNSSTKLVTAKGNVVMSSQGRRLVADEGTYNLTDGTLHVRHMRLGQYPFYLTGETVDGTMDNLVLTNATIFLREQAAYAPSVTADKLVYRQGRIASGEGLKLGLLGGHFISLPTIEHDLHSELISYFDARLGYRHSLGAIFDLGLRVPIAEGVRVGADAGYYTARGLMVGPTAGYSRGDGDDFVRGYIRSGYINDHGDKKTDILGDPVPEDRSYIEWRHQQQIGPHISLNGEFNYWSDSEILRDFRPKAFDPDQQPDSFLEGAYTADNYIFSAFLRVHPNPYHIVQERLPEVRFDLLPLALPGGFYERFNASFAVLQQDAYQNLPKMNSTRLDAYYGLERPIAVTPWLTFTPVAGGRVTYYANAINGRDTYTRTIGEVGFDAMTRMSGTWNYKNEAWDIDGLRHILEPRLSYRYAPEAGSGQPYIPAIDRQVFTTYLPPLSIADSRNIDDLTRLDTLRFSLNNTLQTRDKRYGSRDLAQLNFAADYRFATQPGQRNFSDLYTEMAVMPAPWLRLEAFERFDTHDTIQQELNYGITVHDQDWWSARLASHFLKNDYEEYTLEYSQRLNEVFGVAAKFRYDAKLNRLNEQTYGLTHRWGQTWLVRYEVSWFQGPRRESSFGLDVRFDLLKF